MIRPTSDKPLRVLFVIAEDWFFVSHFLPLAEALGNEGFEVGVHLRVNDPALRSQIEAKGIRVVPANFSRVDVRLLDLVRQVGRLRAVFRRERPDVVHLISLRMIVLGGIAAFLARVPFRIQALTGLGLIGAMSGMKSSVTLALLGWCLRYPLGGARVAHIFENHDDPRRLGLDAGRSKLLIVGGAGIDPERETALAFPASSPLKVAVISRMIFSKGVDVAAEATTRARARGADMMLTLAGAPDLGNPRSLTEEDLATLSRLPGVTWIGRTDDVRGIWRDHHVVCVPSRGGEGLPRSLLEGAAAGRAVVTTDTPGCATFVRDGIEGLVVRPGDADALAAAFIRLAGDCELVKTMGAAARQRVLDGFTMQDVAGDVIGLYRDLLGQSPGARVETR